MNRKKIINYIANGIIMPILLGSLLLTGCSKGGSTTPFASSDDTVKVYSNQKEVASISNQTSSQKLDLGDGSIVKVGTYENLLSIFKNMGLLYTDNSKEANGSMADGAYDTGTVPRSFMEKGETDNAMQAAETGADMAGGGYSETNTQTKGVDEADVLKNDGTYIYYLKNNSLEIIDTRSGSPKSIGSISLQNSTNININDIYIAGDVLVLNGNRYEYLDKDGKQINPYETKTTDDMNAAYPTKIPYDMNAVYPIYNKNYTTFLVYDISDRINPKLTRTVEAEGYAVSTRLIGNNLYFVTNKWIPSIAYGEAIHDFQILPSYRDTAVSDRGTVLDVSCISYFPESRDSQYMLVGAFDITKNDAVVPQAYLGSGQIIYMNQNSLYVTKAVYQHKTETEIYRFSVMDASVEFTGKASVPGHIINQYSMDEYNGILRIATGDYSTGNGITTIDINTMNTVGSISGLAAHESIYSVRFMGDVGYMVTYRQVDPLFVFDLSDPANPIKTGELKIPGFSQYLHPVGANYLVGFGRSTEELYYLDENGNYIPTGQVSDMGFKLSLFDVSDLTDPKEVFVKKYEQNTYSDASYNPKSIMVDARHDIFAFPISNYGSEKNNYTYTEGGTVVQINPETGFVTLADKGGYTYNSRFCYIGDKLYYVTQDTISVYSYPDCSFIEEVSY